MIQAIISLFRPAPLVLEDKAAATRDANRCMAQAGLDGLSTSDGFELVHAWLSVRQCDLSDEEGRMLFRLGVDLDWERKAP